MCGSYTAARAPVAAHFGRMRREGRPCFENGARRDLKGPSCSRAQKVHCPHLNAWLCPVDGAASPCDAYPPSAAQLLQEGLATIGPPLRLASPGPLVAAVRK